MLVPVESGGAGTPAFVVTEVAAIVPEPVAARDAPEPTTIAAVVFVPEPN